MEPLEQDPEGASSNPFAIPLLGLVWLVLFLLGRLDSVAPKKVGLYSMVKVSEIKKGETVYYTVTLNDEPLLDKRGKLRTFKSYGAAYSAGVSRKIYAPLEAKERT